MLPANDKLDWKVIASYEHSSLFGLVVSNEGKSFIILATGFQTTSYKSVKKYLLNWPPDLSKKSQNYYCG